VDPVAKITDLNITSMAINLMVGWLVKRFN